ncbi:serine threonine protein kinase-like protein [Stylonychia lemnae]|uniref:Serine threonine protein kinase-like protein n=1 Tax=Stylonychia lemnae TaxID=5949 RepID=A0A078A479_STYLE|nr:serine threonine protein kinase-like protein [Stylonychia lemnae]|eukprot:CDW76957.1 serine threonine protein kinase-like protein [Stylonychia lemnae]
MQAKMQNYLSQTGIEKLLNDSFKQVAINKPSDPILFIAEYLQQRAHAYESNNNYQEETAPQKTIYASNIQEKNIKFDSLDQTKQKSIKDEKRSTVTLITKEDLNRDFTEEDAITITKNKLAGLNYQQINTDLQTIAEDQEIENDEDDSDENQQTALPQAAFQQDHTKYQTNLSNNFLNSTRISTNLNGQSPSATKISQKNKNTNYPEDFKTLYMMIKNNTVLTISDIIEQFQDDFKHNPEQLYELASQNQTLTLVDFENQQNNEGTPSAKQLEEYLSSRSKKYQNVIEINELASGAEAIVFRLEHHEIDEVVIKTNKVLSKSKNPKNFQQPFIDFMRETLQLKLLQNKNFIAEVREEIIEYDLIKQQISSPEKLAYFFYQSLSIIKYLHSKNFFYGDMKPQNLLIFRNMKVKVGDLGISFKLDSQIESNKQFYLLKGLTKLYSTEAAIKAMENSIFLSQEQLFEADRYNLIRVFQISLESLKRLHGKQQSKYQYLPQQMLDDLTQSDSISSVHEKYQLFFRKNDDFVTKLFEQMKFEFKFDAIQVISRISRYSEIFENKVFKIIRKISEYSQSKQNDYLKTDNTEQSDSSFATSYNPKRTSKITLDILSCKIRNLSNQQNHISQ